MSQPTPLTYRDAGVDIDAGNAVVERIKPLVRRSFRPEVMGGLGGFGALFDLSGKYREPVLVSGTDGVGTKLKLAIEHDRHDGVGIDLAVDVHGRAVWSGECTRTADQQLNLALVYLAAALAAGARI